METNLDILSILLVTAPLLILVVALFLFPLKFSRLRFKPESEPTATDNRYQAFFDRANEAIFIVEDGVFVDCNPKTLEMFRCSKDAIIGQTPSKVSPAKQPDGRPSTLASGEYVKAALSGIPQQFEWQHRRFDGEVFYANVSLSRVVTGDKDLVLGFVRDVNELKIANAKLANMVAEQTIISDSIPDLLYKLNSEGRLLWWNRRFEDLTGLGKAELKWKPLRELIASDDVPVFDDWLSETLQNGGGDYELRFLTPTGPVLHQVKSVGIKNETGDAVEITNIARDVNQERNIEKALQTIANDTSAFVGEDFFEALVKQLANTLGVRQSFVGRVYPENPGAVRTIASWNGGVAEDNFSYMLPGTPGEYVFDRELCIFDRDVRQQFPADRLLADLGAESYAGVPLFSSTQVPIGILAVIDDKPMEDNLIIRSVLSDFATRAGAELDRMQFEEKLHQSAAVMENSDEGIMVTDASNRIVAVNDSFTRITGFSEHEVLGKNPRILRSDKESVSHYKTMWQSIDAFGKWQGEIWNRKNNGEHFPCWLRISTIKDKQGNITNYIGVFSDTSSAMKAEERQRNLELQLLQAQKMEALGQLTGGIAHDFNNILSSILGYTDLAMSLGVKDEKDKLGNYLKEVYHGGERARDLIAQMLTFSRTSSSGEKHPVPVAPILKDVVKMLRPLIPSSMNLHLEDQLDPGQVVDTDVVQLHQLIVNLCINARDAIGDKGNITLRTAVKMGTNTVCSSCHQNFLGDFIEISVRDDGGGMTPETVSHIFDPFFTTKEIGKGTGMGLAMVHGIVHDHGGHVCVQTQPDKGTEFNILLPLVEPDNTNKNEKDIRPARELKGQQQEILVVDDEIAVAGLIREQLNQLNYRVTVYNDSQQALDHFREDAGRYDLVITDQTMPKLMGSEMSKLMLDTRPNLPVILCTGFSGQADENKLKESGIQAIIKKPYDLRTLLETINRLLTPPDIRAS